MSFPNDYGYRFRKAAAAFVVAANNHQAVGIKLLLSTSALLATLYITRQQEVLPTAFFYGAPVPVNAFDGVKRLVVEAESVEDVNALTSKGLEVFAYISAGEAEAWRTSTASLKEEIFLEYNSAWGSKIADLTNPAWHTYLLEDRIAPLWNAGYKAFFLDTLDSYKLSRKSHADREAQRYALIDLIRTIHKRFPGVQLLLNRGFEILNEVHSLVVGVVAESLFRSWDPHGKRYVQVSEQDTAWLLAQLNHIKEKYDLPVTVIDYVPSDQADLGMTTAKRISASGFSAWVSNYTLDAIGWLEPR